MEIIVFSDLHNNYFSLKRFYKNIKENYSKNVKIYFLGDLIGYLKFDERIVNLIIQMKKEYDMTLLAGNHDAAFFNHLRKTNLTVKLSNSLKETIKNNIKHTDNILKIYPLINFGIVTLILGGKKIVLSHGGPTDIYNHYYYPDLKFINQYSKYFEKDVDYIFGHTHHPFIVKTTTNTFINVGSLGLPRNQDPRMSYIYIDEGNPYIIREFYNLDYAFNYNKTLPNKIKNRIYFGGNSIFLEYELQQLIYEERIIKNHFSNYKMYDRCIYIEENKNLFQIYKLKDNIRVFFLLRYNNKEKTYNEINKLIRSIRNEGV